jgi:hypothetical protein
LHFQILQKVIKIFKRRRAEREREREVRACYVIARFARSVGGVLRGAEKKKKQ